MPKISVIIPIYKVENYIARCARSLFEQTLDDIEFIFIDDCTPDQSIDILKNEIQKYSSIFVRKRFVAKIFKMPRNSGLPAVRRYGVQLATGDYIIHCDSDDWVDISMYEKMYHKAIECDADIVVCQYARSDGKNVVPDMTYFNSISHVSDMLLEKSNWSLCNRLCHKSLYDNITFPKKNMGEDCHVVIQLSLKANNIVCVPEVLYYYYSNPNSMCRIISEETAYNRYLEVLENVGYIINLLINNKYYDENSSEIINLKNHCRDKLVSIINVWSYYKLWLSTYPEINYKYFLARKITLRKKLSFCTKLFYIYPLVIRILRLFPRFSMV